MRTTLFGLTLCVAALAQTAPAGRPAARPDVDVEVPPSARNVKLQVNLPVDFPENPKPNTANSNQSGEPVASFAEFVAPEVISKIVADQWAYAPNDVRRDLAALPTSEAISFGPNPELCAPGANSGERTGARLSWFSTSQITFESGRTGRLAVAWVNVARGRPQGPPPFYLGVGNSSDCLGPDKVPYGSLFVRYMDPDGYTWSFAVPLQRKQ